MSIVAMKRKMEAKKNQSVGGKFSLNGRRCGSDVVPQSVKNSKYSNRKHYKTKACFNGQDGVMCERVWDGSKMPGIWENYGGGVATGESLTQEEYIEEKRLKSTQCINLLFTYINVVLGVTKITVFKDGDSYSITFRGKNYSPRWNHDNALIASVVGTEAEGTIEGIGVKGRRVTTVKIGTTELTFENPEISIFEPVGCIDDIAEGGGGAQTGGGTSLNDVGYYGRNKCKVFFVNKDRSFEPLSFGGLGGYLERIKQPGLDPSYCGV